MKKIELQIEKTLRMTCMQISNLTGVRHDSVKRTIETLGASGIISLPQIVVVKVKRTRRYENVDVYTFIGEQGERDSLIVIAQVSPKATALIVDEWRALKLEVVGLRQQIADRSQARMEAPEMTAALSEQRALIGKGTVSHHYSNEYNMINRIVLGFTSKQYALEHGLSPDQSIRDTMRPQEIAAISKLQQANISLIDMGIEYQERKVMLNKLLVLGVKQFI